MNKDIMFYIVFIIVLFSVGAVMYGNGYNDGYKNGVYDVCDGTDMITAYDSQKQIPICVEKDYFDNQETEFYIDGGMP
jgi:hypothetical protein